MRIHSETNGVHHPDMAELAPSMVVLEAYRGSRGVLAADGRAAGLALIDRPEGYRWLHIGSAEKFLCPRNVTEPGVVIPGLPNNETFARGIVRGRLSAALLVEQLDAAVAQLLTTLYAAGADLDGIWIDAEDEPNSNAVTASGRKSYPGLNELFVKLFPERVPVQFDGVIAAVVYEALKSALGALGIDRRILAAWMIADRPLGWDKAENVRFAAALADGTPVRVDRPHMVCTLPNPETTVRLEHELKAGSGPSRAVVHLSTVTPPEIVRERLAICARLGVQDVILFYQGVDEDHPNLSEAEHRRYAIRLLDAQLPAFRQFTPKAA